MTSKIFSIYDSKLGAYMQPFFMLSRGAALRAFSDEVNNPQSPFYKHPQDYTLFEIGEYDDQSAKLTDLQVKIPVVLALELSEKSPHNITNINSPTITQLPSTQE